MAYFVDSFPSVLESYSHSGGNTKPREDFESFHYFQKTVTKNVNGKNVTAKIKLDVGVRKEHIETYEDYSASLVKDKKIGCIVNEYLRDQRENPAAATVGKPLGTSAKQPCKNIIPFQVENVNFSKDMTENDNEAYHYRTEEITEDAKSHDERRRNTYYQNNKHRKGLPPRLSSMASDKNIPLQGEIVNIDIEILEDKAMGRQNIIMDSQSKRSIDRNGFMHVELCNITKESVDPYFGREIPRHRELGLDPETIYYGWRKGDELEKAARTFCGLPLMREHHFDSSEAPQREHRVGSVGTDCAGNLSLFFVLNY